MVDGEEKRLEFVGMEFVRTDWTRLAKEFQVELYQQIFNNEEIHDWLRDFVNKSKEAVSTMKSLFTEND